MRKTMQKCVRELIEKDENSALLLIDIGIWPFHDLLEKYPRRVKNIGIFEPGTVGIAAGLSLSGITPVVYGISPFIVERSLEQLKLDFVYQNLNGNFITTGGSYDFSTLGYSHYCPEDVSLLYQLPGFDILTPSTPSQFEKLWNTCALNGRPSYFRMTDHSCKTEIDVEYGKASIIKKGNDALVICAAEMLDGVCEACRDLDVTVLYYSTIQPFDIETVLACYNEKIIICEPFYEGTVSQILLNGTAGKRSMIFNIGIPREVIRNYGTKEEKDIFYKLDRMQLRQRIIKCIESK